MVCRPVLAPLEERFSAGQVTVLRAKLVCPEGVLTTEPLTLLPWESSTGALLLAAWASEIGWPL
jgi:hypothetical protein